MAQGGRAGLRVKIKTLLEAKRQPAKTNAQRCKEYRDKLKEDPEAYQQYLQQARQANAAYRKKPKTQEELDRQREQTRLRVQKLRAKRKAEDKAISIVTPRKTRRAAELDTAATSAQRQKWAEEKRKQREKWNGNKWQWHRKKNREAYHRRMEKQRSIPVQHAAPDIEVSPPPSSSPSPLLSTPVPSTCTSSSMSESSIKQRVDQLKRRRDKKSLACRRLLTGKDIYGTSPYKRKKKNCETTDTIKHLEEIAVDLPGKKTVHKKTGKQQKVLPSRLKTLHRQMLKKKICNLSLRTLYRHLPKYIKTVKSHVYRQCLCDICENVDLKLIALNPFLTEKIDGHDTASELTLCEKPSSSCYDRKCSKCGVHVLEEHIKKNLTVSPELQTVKWFAWNNTPKMNREKTQNEKREMTSQSNKSKATRMMKVRHENTLAEMINTLLKAMRLYSKHVFTHKFQYMQYKLLLSKLPILPEKKAVVVADFSENYLCRHQDEAQSAHWNYSQVTVHPTVLYYPCAHCNSLVTEYLVFLSDDLYHDACIFKTILQQTVQHLRGLGIKRTVVFSDGCPTHYKAKLPFYHMSMFPDTERAFFGARHGKGPCDACGGVVKSLVDQDVRAGEVMVQNAQHMYDHLNAKHLLPDEVGREKACIHTKRSFFLVKSTDIDRSLPSSDLKTIQGTRLIHHVRGIERGVLESRNLACFCDFCLGLGGHHCAYQEFVAPWKIIKTKFSKKSQQPECEPASSCQQPPSACDLAAPPAEPASSLPSACEPTALSAEPAPFPIDPGQPFSGSSLSLPDSPPPPSDCASSLDHTPPSSQAPSSAADFQLQPDAITDRNSFFKRLLQRMSSSATFDELISICKQYQATAASYELPTDVEHFISSTPGLCVDAPSLSMIPDNAPKRHFPVAVDGDGNCFFRSLSVLLFGHQNFHEEMRARVIIEMATNMDTYLSVDFLSQGEKKLRGEDLFTLMRKYGESDFHWSDSPKEFLKKEILHIKHLKTQCGIWHILGAASMMNTKLHVVYPTKGPQEIQHLASRTIHPRTPSAYPNFTRAIMWTSHRSDMEEEYWVPSHFVPFLPIHPEEPVVDEDERNAEDTNTTCNSQENCPRVDDFFIYRWLDGKQYMCQVLGIADDGLVYIQFFKKQNIGSSEVGFSLPSSPETSWEEMDCFVSRSQKVHLQLDEVHSTNKKQIFKMI